MILSTSSAKQLPVSYKERYGGYGMLTRISDNIGEKYFGYK